MATHTEVDRVDGAKQQIESYLRDWCAAHLISDAQANSIRAFEDERRGLPAPPTVPSTKVPVLVEVLGYLGIVLVGAAGAIAVGNVWDDVATAVQLVFIGVVTLLIAGAATWLWNASAPPVVRLANVLWLLADGGVAAFVTVATLQGFEWDEEAVLLSVALLAGGGAAALLVLRGSSLHHLATWGWAVTAVASSMAWIDAGRLWAGLALWALGGLWIAASWGRLLPHPRMGFALGALSPLFAPVVITDGPFAGPLWFGAATAVAMFALSFLARSRMLMGFGIAGLLIYATWLIAFYFAGSSDDEGTVNVPMLVALIVLGLGLITGAVIAARRAGKRAAPDNGV
jgi:hypothetical protein